MGNEKGKKRIVLTVAVAVVVLLAGGGTAYGVADSQARGRFEQAQAEAVAEDKRLASSISHAQTTLDTIKTGQVKDGKTLDALKAAVNAGGKIKGVPSVDDGGWMLWKTNGAVRTLTSDANEAAAQTQAIEKTVSAVNGSVKAKRLADAKGKLESKLIGARKLLKDSNGKVADDKTRQVLDKAITAAAKAGGDKNVSDPKAYDEQTVALDKAIKTVNDSIAKKTAADQANAAAQSATQQATQGGNSYTGGGYSGGSSYGSYGSGSAGSTGGSAATGNGGGARRSTSGAQSGGGSPAPTPKKQSTNKQPSGNSGGSGDDGWTLFPGGHDEYN